VSIARGALIADRELSGTARDEQESFSTPRSHIHSAQLLPYLASSRDATGFTAARAAAVNIFERSEDRQNHFGSKTEKRASK